MTNTQELTSLLRKLQSSNRFAQTTATKAIAAYIQEAKRSEVEELLELLISTHDLEIQVKLLSILAAYLINNGTYYEVIIKFNPIYDTIQNLLVRGLPLKAVTALTFVVALVCCDDGGQRHLAIQARNMIRVSGCLNAMAEMFSSSMMYQDTWVALCRSLAESCTGSEVNQSYCSHLVPLCVDRCQQGNVDVCAVLQSLLHNHDRNVKLFIECQGLAIFTRQSLQYNMCMQLLSTVVERSTEAVSILRNTNVVYCLRDFVHLYGPYSQMGQWSTLILFHFNRGEVGSTANVTSTVMQEPDVNRNLNETNTAMDVDQSIRNKTKDLTVTRSNSVRQRSVLVSKRNDTLRIGSVPNPEQNPEDTATLFQNVIKEVIYWKSRDQGVTKPSTSTPLIRPKPKKLPLVISFQNNPKNQRNEKTPEKELTFSFLMQESRQHTKKPEFYGNNKLIASFLTDADKISSNFTNRHGEEEIREQSDHSEFNTVNYNQTVFALKYFNPPFQSTPKRIGKTNRTRISRRCRHSRKLSRNYTKVSKASKPEKGTMTLQNGTMTKQNSTLNPTRDIKQTSMSARFLNAINESCTTFVKSVKSIFRSKQPNTDNDKTMTYENSKDECSYSFTNYMRKRDALLERELSDEDSGAYKVDSCKTCKDTIVLQQKMVRDDNLKHTVKKLKKGINLYGCDFKKISRAFWPRDKYMTPEMLYNLYRKLIVKGGHGDHEFRQKAYNIMRKK